MVVCGRVFVDFAKLGIEAGVTVSTEDVSCTFSERGFELRVCASGNRQRLCMRNLREPIAVEKCAFRLRNTRIVVVLHKVDEQKTWWELTSASHYTAAED